MHEVIVTKGRQTNLEVNFAYDLTGATFSSQIREAPSSSSPLIAEWDVSLLTDGTDGKLMLSLPPEDTADIVQTIGYMDIKKVVGSVPYKAFEGYLMVVFEESVTE